MRNALLTRRCFLAILGTRASHGCAGILVVAIETARVLNRSGGHLDADGPVLLTRWTINSRAVYGSHRRCIWRHWCRLGQQKDIACFERYLNRFLLWAWR